MFGIQQARKIALICIILFSKIATAANPNIMVSIKPFYNICAKIMQGVGTPQLLIQSNDSPHDYQLKPSAAKLINEADLIIWGGPGIDGYLIKSIENMPKTSMKDLDLTKVANIKILAAHHTPAWDQEADHVHPHHPHDHYDPHIWLSPHNAIAISKAIADRLTKIDPEHATVYQNNAQTFHSELLEKDKVWQTTLRPYGNVPYLVFHDAYQYFNDFFELDGVGAISIHPEIPPSVQRIAQIRDLLQHEQIACVFSEPQFNAKILDSLVVDTKVYKGILDPLGQDQDLGPDGYFKLIDKLVDSFALCGQSALK